MNILKRQLIVITMISVPFFLNWTIAQDKWLSKKHNDYTIFYTAADIQNITEYEGFIENAERTVIDFFQMPFKTNFNICIHPNRASLDSTWQADWNVPGFKSQCWMVASGVAEKLDMISPKMWDSLSCEHSYSDSLKTQQLIAHEFIHVYHGQYNVSPDFSDVSGIDWFVEGLAVYGSGQCDSVRIREVKSAILKNETPGELSNFWTGKLRYGLSGTVVMYMDKKYGRKALTGLLRYNNMDDLLEHLNTTEQDLLAGWTDFMMELQGHCGK